MRKAEREFAAARVVIASLMGLMAITLAGCDESSGTGTSVATAAASGSASSTTPTSGSSGASQGSQGSGSTTTTVTPTPTPPPKPAPAASVTLGWIPPTQNSDGTPITNLAGYKIHYGTMSSSYSQTIALQNAGLTRYVVDNLPSGTYYFAITAYNAQ
ncbi:MAG TPA: fibronectin type III domain-containing protein, partial [Steroidobacteraceae bacterium]